MSDREYTQIIDALRWNGKEYKGSTMDEDDKQLFCDAADAIEELMAMLDLARDSNSGLRKEMERAWREATAKMVAGNECMVATAHVPSINLERYGIDVNEWVRDEIRKEQADDKR